ncbi:MAG: O-antigen ligase family protein [Thiomicrorhabdus sp.]|nr:O-antigen ligase family protein [Thiomicrorhabdus sp.]
MRDIYSASSFKLLFLALLIMYLAGSAMMLKSADTFFYLLFLMSLFKVKSIPEHFKEVPVFRFFVVVPLLMFLFVLISTVLSQPFSLIFSFQFEVFRNLLFLPIIFNALLTVRITQKELILIILLIGSYTFFYTIAVFWQGSVRSSGLLTGAIQRGNLAVIYAVLALILMYFSHYRWQKIAAFIIFISGIVLSMQTGSKGGWLALVISFSTLFVLFLLYDRRQLLFLCFKVFALALVLFLLWEFLPVQGRIESAFKGLIDYFSENGFIDGSVGARLEIWKVTLLAIQDFNWFTLLFGQGFLSFMAHFEQAQLAGVTSLSLLAVHPHNDFLKLLFEFGIFGLILFSAIFIYPMFLLLKEIKGQANFYHVLAGILLIEMLLEFMLTDSAVFTKQLLYTYLFLIFILLISFRNQHESPYLGHKKSNTKL